ncbi:hypothetical protein [Paludisphaera mucosa]|uniref:DUF4131 domain-containing protein n=1 Tax=Paludisphaera mucosa TaxID=3030827 RepID=A0ABT6F3L9_9BACT|nr:hypothetical protein [Paludisphaera mucosa]MDG3002166.1 hypothetical protein [Paludisphaera mucosa]
MSTRSAAMAFRLALAAAVGAIAVVTPVELLILPLAAWAFLTWRWAAGGFVGWAAPAAVLVAVAAAAAFAPVKNLDRIKDRRITVPRATMTIAELREPEEHGLARPSLSYSMGSTAGTDERVVRFASPTPSIREFIGAIEAQAGLRHRFYHCLNGWTILWGYDATTGLGFSAPRS